MNIKTWSTLTHTIGKLQGIATVLEITEEIDMKKLKENLTEIAGKLQTIADEESGKFDEIKKPAEKKNGGTKK